VNSRRSYKIFNFREFSQRLGPEETPSSVRDWRSQSCNRSTNLPPKVKKKANAIDNSILFNQNFPQGWGRSDCAPVADHQLISNHKERRMCCYKVRPFGCCQSKQRRETFDREVGKKKETVQTGDAKAKYEERKEYSETDTLSCSLFVRMSLIGPFSIHGCSEPSNTDVRENTTRRKKEKGEEKEETE
jgi:hypothetical protein